MGTSSTRTGTAGTPGPLGVGPLPGTGQPARVAPTVRSTSEGRDRVTVEAVSRTYERARHDGEASPSHSSRSGPTGTMRCGLRPSCDQ